MVVLLLENITPGMKHLASVKESDETEGEALIYDCQVGQPCSLPFETALKTNPSGRAFYQSGRVRPHALPFWTRKSGISRPNPKP
jgi:hypothetical protein